MHKPVDWVQRAAQSATNIVAFEHEWVDVGAAGLSAQELHSVSQANLARPGFSDVRANRVYFAQYCGVLSLGGRNLEVLPKIGFADHGQGRSRDLLARWLRDSQLLPTTLPMQTGQDVSESPLLDVLVATFIESVAKLLRQGLLNSYRTKHEDLTTVRGRINGRRQFGNLAGRKDYVACTFDDFGPDIPLNQLLKRALVLVVKCCGATTSQHALAMLASFSDVSDVPFHPTSIIPQASDRASRRYVVAVSWAELIIRSLTPSIRSGETRAPGLLFDMNKVFEGVASRRLSRDVRATPGYSMSTQDTSAHLGHHHDRPTIPLRPDVVIRRGGATIAVVDAKWKHLVVGADGMPVIDRSDIYQMLAYAVAFDAPEVTLVYPAHQRLHTGRLTPIRLKSGSGTSVHLSVLLVDMEDPAYTVKSSAYWYDDLLRASQ